MWVGRGREGEGESEGGREGGGVSSSPHVQKLRAADVAEGAQQRS